MEKDLIASAYPFRSVEAMPLAFPGRKMAKFLLSLLKGVLQSLLILSKVRPRVVLGMGGYASFPPLFASYLLRIPFLIHEQNVIPGRANRVLGRLAQKVLVSFEETKRFFSAQRTKVTGVPIRSSMQRFEKEVARQRLGLNPHRNTLLVMGGSRGALAINNLLLEMLPSLLERGIQVIHICGVSNYPSIKEKVGGPREGYLLLPFSREMSTLYSSADLCISRAGASTLAEIAFFSLPAILIPYPYAIDQHQLYNALLFQKHGGAIVFKERGLNARKLLRKVGELFSSPQRLEEMSLAVSSLAMPDASYRVAQEVLEVMNK